jgi:SMI1 / KNR4 family (SUKH-1)
MYLDSAQDRVRAASFPDSDDIHPCSLDEVEALEAKLGCSLPESIREFLFWCGKGLGEIWSGSRCLEYDELLKQFGLHEARETLADAGLGHLLPDGKVLLFQFDQDGQFSFVRLDEGDDPAVYTYLEGKGLQRSAGRFSQYVDLIVRQEFGIE